MLGGPPIKSVSTRKPTWKFDRDRSFCVDFFKNIWTCVFQVKQDLIWLVQEQKLTTSEVKTLKQLKVYLSTLVRGNGFLNSSSDTTKFTGSERRGWTNSRSQNLKSSKHCYLLQCNEIFKEPSQHYIQIFIKDVFTLILLNSLWFNLDFSSSHWLPTLFCTMFSLSARNCVENCE